MVSDVNSHSVHASVGGYTSLVDMHAASRACEGARPAFVLSIRGSSQQSSGNPRTWPIARHSSECLP